MNRLYCSIILSALCCACASASVIPEGFAPDLYKVISKELKNFETTAVEEILGAPEGFESPVEFCYDIKESLLADIKDGEQHLAARVLTVMGEANGFDHFYSMLKDKELIEACEWIDRQSRIYKSILFQAKEETGKNLWCKTGERLLKAQYKCF